MSLAGCQLNPIDVNFHLQKVWQFLMLISADKIWSKKNKEIKVSPLTPIRVNQRYIVYSTDWFGVFFSFVLVLEYS